MDPVSGATTGVKIASLSGKLLWDLHRREEVGNLFSAIPKAVRSDHRIPAERHDEVIRAVEGLKVDPRTAGCLKALLEGHSAAYGPLEERLGQLLRLDDAEQSAAVVEAVMSAVRANVIGAKRDIMAAASTIYREQLGAADELTGLRQEVRESAEAARTERREIAEGMRSGAGAGAAYRLITGEQATSRETPKLLVELGDADRLSADEASAALGDGGPARLASWARERSGTLCERGAEVCASTGRLLMAEREFAAAELLLVLAAEQDSEEPGRQWARAANAAFLDERPNRGVELLDRARELLDPGHPALALVELSRSEPTGPEILARLEGVEPVTDGDRLRLATARAQGHLLNGDFTAADEPLREAERLDLDSPQVIELRGLWRLQRASTAIAADGDVDAAELEAAERDFLRLRDELRRLGRDRESAAMLSRAVEAALDAGRLDRARELLSLADASERRAPAGLALARQALMCELPDMAIVLAKEAEESELARVVQASAEIFDGSAQSRNAALGALEKLLGSADEEVRVEAALARAVASIDGADGPKWSERAGEILAERDAGMARVMQARAYLAHGQIENAEALLRRAGNDARALGALVDAAALVGDFDKALQRSEALLRVRRTPETSLQHARLLKRAGRHEQALAELSAVARNREVLLPAVRERAYREAADAAQRLDRYAEMERLCDEALEAGSADATFHWGRAWARFKLSRHAQALADLDAAGLAPSTLEEAELLARLLYAAAPIAEALRRNVELCRRFDGPERLDALLIMMHARAQEPDPETDAAVAEILNTFVQRYPQSSILQQREVPDSEEGLRAFLNEIAPRRRDPALVEQVKDGSLVTAVLAGVHNRSVSELWAALQLLPLSYGDSTLTELELQDAHAAVGTGAVLDPSSLSVLALLGEEVERAVFAALPGSVVSQATLADADRGANPVNDPSFATGGVTRDARTGEPVLFEHDPTETVALATRQSETLRIARGLHVEPDAVPGGGGELEPALLDKDNEVESALRTWAATMTVAHRHGLPVLSDDRRVRGSMRAGGVPSFGTLELLQALAQAGDVDPELAAVARARLLASGGVGLRPSGAELAAMARDLGWQPSAHIFVVLSDPTLWMPEPAAGWAACGSFLRTVWGEAPQEFEQWTARVIDAAKQAAPHVDLELMCFGLLADAWGWTGADGVADGPFLRALVGALRHLGAHLGQSPRVDPVVYALKRFANVTMSAPSAQRAIFALRAISLLGHEDQMWALATLWE